MKPDLSKLVINLPEGLTQKGSPVLTGNTVEFTVVAKKEGNFKPTVSFNGGEAKAFDINAVYSKITKIDNSVTGIVGGHTYTLKVSTDGPIDIKDMVITVPEGWTKDGEPSFADNLYQCTYVTPRKASAKETLTATYFGSTASIDLNLIDPALNAFLRVESESPEVSVGADINLTLVYKDNVTEEDKTATKLMKLPDGVTEKTPFTISGRTMKVTYTSTTAGAKSFTFQAYAGDPDRTVTRNVSVTVK